MSGLLEQNPNPKKMQNEPKRTKSKFRVSKVAGVLVLAVAVVSVGKYGLDTFKENLAAKKEEASINALMQKQQEEEEARKERVANSKVAYLTFDDGPNYNTEKILDILKENNIKATFFLVGSMVENNPSIVKRIQDEGHTLGNHTYSHKYSYSTKEEFLSEVEKTDELISKALGTDYKSYFVRVPGGSMGKKIAQEAIRENGYKSINWTGMFGDDEKGGKVDSKYVENRVKETTGDDQYEVILAHGTKSITVATLQTIIDNLKADGYIFEPLMIDSPVEFS